MSLHIDLTLPKPTILYQENPDCTLTLENRGAKAVKIIPPRMANRWPVLRLIDLNTGKASLHESCSHPSEKEFDPPWMDLAPGQRSLLGFTLKGKIPDLPPGEYELTARYRYNEGDLTTKSQPVRLTVKPSTPHNLFLASAVGRASNSYFGSWIDLDRESAHVVWAKIDLMSGGGVQAVRIVDQADGLSEPVLSVPVNGTMAPGQWVAWVHKGQMTFTFLKPQNPVGEPGSAILGNNTARIVGPMLWKPSGGENSDTPAGEALLILGSPPNVQLQAFELSGISARPGEAAKVTGGLMPAWIRNVYLAEGKRLAPYILCESGRMALSMLSWDNGKVITATSLASWDGDFLAACCIPDEKDIIHGAVLTWAGRADDAKALVVIPWTLDPDGRFSEGDMLKTEWDAADSISRADISLSPKDLFVAVVRKDNGKWFFINPAGIVSPLKGAFAKDDRVLAVNFANLMDPVIIGGTRSVGLRIMQPDGSPVPPPPTRRK